MPVVDVEHIGEPAKLTAHGFGGFRHCLTEKDEARHVGIPVAVDGAFLPEMRQGAQEIDGHTVVFCAVNLDVFCACAPLELE